MAGTSKHKVWRSVAKQFGLEYDKEAGGILSGKLNGFNTIIGLHPSGELVGMIAFIPPLDLFWDEGDVQELEYREGRFHPPHVRGAALLDDDMKAALDSLTELGHVVLRLVCLRVSLARDLTESAELVKLVEGLAAAATCIDKNREIVPVEPANAALEAPMERLGSELGLRVTRSPLGVEGTKDGQPVSVWVWQKGSVAITVGAEAPEGLKVEMDHHTPTLLERWGVVSQGDPEIGDKDLDKRLTIETDDIEALKRRLGPGELEALRTLLAGGKLNVKNGRVMLGDADIQEIPALVSAAMKIAAALGSATPNASPFR
jgi:hypothetical protein